MNALATPPAPGPGPSLAALEAAVGEIGAALDYLLRYWPVDRDTHLVNWMACHVERSDRTWWHYWRPVFESGAWSAPDRVNSTRPVGWGSSSQRFEQRVERVQAHWQGLVFSKAHDHAWQAFRATLQPEHGGWTWNELNHDILPAWRRQLPDWLAAQHLTQVLPPPNPLLPSKPRL